MSLTGREVAALSRRPARPLMIGQAPCRGGDPESPCTGRAGRFMAASADVEFLRFVAAFDRVNLVHDFPGKSGKGDAFPMSEARARAAEMIPHLAGRTVVLLGRGVAAALGVGGLPYLEWGTAHGADVVVVPHPSGVNRWWNDPACRAAAGGLLRAVYDVSPLGKLSRKKEKEAWP